MRTGMQKVNATSTKCMQCGYCPSRCNRRRHRCCCRQVDADQAISDASDAQDSADAAQATADLKALQSW